MESNITFKTGEYNVHLLEAGRFAMDAGTIFGIIPKPLWYEEEKPDKNNKIELACRSILIEGKGKKILVETGIDPNLSSKMKEIYKVDLSEYSLEKSLETLGVSKTEITDVFVTHLHFDHCGGNVRMKKGTPKPNFPNANYHIQKKHWEWAHSPSVLDRNSFIARNFECLAEYDNINLLDEEKTLYENLKILKSDGHTPGQQLLLIEDEEAPLFYGGDVLPFRWSSREPWISAFELNSLKLLKEKKHYLKRAASENWRVVFTHDPQYQTAQIKKGDKYHKSYNFKSEI